ncbi:MAG: carboxypeptidase regulatory-like domain-containing protein [Chlorobiales bacterium]|nr:carboxypeptidase regulatory-like domain-containing protein [Chlorobiales bacterium]
MGKRTTRFIKTAVLLTSFGFITSNAFCGGTITGKIETNMSKYKGDAVVYLVDVKGPVVPQHKSIDQRCLTFIPKVTTIPVGSTVDITNNDKVYHNVNSTSPSKKFNIDTYDPGTPKPITFDRPGVVHLLCKTHSEMGGWVIITNNQYAAVTEHDGKFSIPDVPAGTYEIATWSEKLKQTGRTTVTIDEGKTVPVVIKLTKISA